MQKYRDIRIFRKVVVKADENAVDSGQTGEFNFFYLLIKDRKVSRGYDTRNQFARKRTWVRIPSSLPKRRHLETGAFFIFVFSKEKLPISNRYRQWHKLSYTKPFSSLKRPQSDI